METVSQFAGRYKKNSTIEAIRVKNAHRKSLTRKENRFNQFRKSRRFGVSDFSPLKESQVSMIEEHDVFLNQQKPAEQNEKPMSQARKNMLQRYKEEKVLKKMQEEREKSRRGVFKVGLYKPDAPCFLPSENTQNTEKTKPTEKAAPAPAGRVTRLTVKNSTEQTRTVTSARPQTAKVPCFPSSVTTNRKGHVETVAPAKGKVDQSRSTRPMASLKESKVPRGPVIAPPRVPVKTTHVEASHSRLTRATASFAAKVQPKATAQVEAPHTRASRATAASMAKMQPKTSTCQPLKKTAGSVQQKKETRHVNAVQELLLKKVEEYATDTKLSPELPQLDMVVGAGQNEYAGDVAQASELSHQDMAVEAGQTESTGDTEQVSELPPLEMVVGAEQKNRPTVDQLAVKDNLSFAPQNFTFQPLDGLSSFKLNPMTPRTADKFLSPCFTWSPVESKRTGVLEMGAKITSTLESPEEAKDPVEQELKESAADLVQDVNGGEPLQETTSASKSFREGVMATPSVSEQEVPVVVEKTDAFQVQETGHDVPYFRNAIQSESERLTSLALHWEGKMELDIPDEVKDLIRTTVGQTRLLIAERFKQFEGLVDDCEFKRGEKETTCTDLDGFWDMVSFQVEDVNKKFDRITDLETSGWQLSLHLVQTKKLVKKKIAAGGSAKPGNGDNGRAAARSRLAAIKASMKAKIRQEEVAIETTTEPVKDADVVVFDAGFFRVESPAKSYNGSTSKMQARLSSGKCRSQMATPGSTSKFAKRNSIMSFASPVNSVPVQNAQISHTIQPPTFSQRNISCSAEVQLESSVTEASEDGNTMMQCTEMINESTVNCFENHLATTLVPTASAEFHTGNASNCMTTEECPAHDPDRMDESVGPLTNDVVMCSPEKEKVLEERLAQSEACWSLERTAELQTLHSLGLCDSDSFPATAEGFSNPLDNLLGSSATLKMPGLDCSMSPSPMRSEPQKPTAASATPACDLIVFSPIGTSQ